MVLCAVLCLEFSGDGQNSKDRLAIVLKWSRQSGGVPTDFRIEITNDSDHDIRLPEPAVECDSSFTGRVGVSFRFVPKVATQNEGRGHACVADTFDWPFILDRVQHWKVLAPGQSIEIVVTPEQMHCECSGAGKYEFWAGYLPPYVSAEEQQILRNSGIYIPNGAISSAHVVIIRP